MLVLENEVDRKRRGLANEIARYTKAEIYDFIQKKELPDCDKIKNSKGVIIAGSTAGVYEDRNWIDKEEEFIRHLADKNIPTLGVCFGHQIINSAFGGKVKRGKKRHARLVKANFKQDPLFNEVKEVVPVLHNDFVISEGDNMEVIANADYYPIFATRHKESPIWTVQFHPEFTPRVKKLGKGWKENKLSFKSSNAFKILKNFYYISKRWKEDSNIKIEK